MISHYWYHFPSADNLWNESKPEEIKCANALLEKVLSPDFILVIFFHAGVSTYSSPEMDEFYTII